MYLKSIEVQGFKSFAHKLTFEFHDGITAIVGPNGSGKSNVADAVRWVLGEQSAKQLRGAKMEDVIFSGTETRKSLSHAYVAITLNNSDHKLVTDYEEVTVARRVYRSGESEYLMNGVNCRLRDIQELFFDTGIGKEGYSIIGQGQIDRILSGKPEERRELFDEAAGIVKFKKRKAAAEKNLEAEKQNLCRVSDILSELEVQMKPLEKQSNKAKEYLRLRDALKLLDINMFLLEYDKIQEELQIVSQKQKLTSDELTENNLKYENAKNEFMRLENEIIVYEERLENKKTEQNNRKVNLEKLDGEIKVCKEQIMSARQNEQHFRERQDIVEQSIAAAKEEQDKYDSEKKSNDIKLEILKDSRSECEKTLQSIHQDITVLEAEILERNNNKIVLLNATAEIKTDYQECKTMLEQYSLKDIELNQRQIQNKSDISLAEELIKTEKEQFLAIREELKRERECREERIEKMKELDCDIEILGNTYQEKQRNFHIETTKLDSLKNMTERYEGYGQSIRRVMDQKVVNKGILGVVADIISVKKEYEIAVETALGGSIQNIVTDTEYTAKHLIEYLKKNKYGRATFLPLTNMKKRGASHSEVLNEPGVIGIVSSLVEYEETFQGLVEYLLGRFIIVETIDHAITLAKKYRHTLRIVTLEGELLSPGGSMSGGLYRNSSNLLGRRREIKDIKSNLEQLRLEMVQIEQEIHFIKSEKERKLIDLETKNKRIRALRLEENTCNMKYEHALKNKEAKEEEHHSILQDEAEVENQRKILQYSADQILNRLTKNEMKSKENESKIAEYNILLSRKRAEDEELREKMASLNMEFSIVNQNIQFIEENRNRVRYDLEQFEKELNSLCNSKEDICAQIVQKETIIEDVKKMVQKHQTRLEELKVQIEEEKKGKEKIVSLQKKHLEQREALSRHISELDKELFRLISQFDKLNEQLDNKIDYMWSEYEITYRLAKDLKTESGVSLLQMRQEAGELRNKIRTLGDININAIEQYANLTERYEHLKIQHDDLVEAEDVLVGIIEELDVEMRKQFSEKFKEIKEQFDKVFKELFGGGKGGLELIEEEDILDAGVCIIAQPPGKKLQNMMQLSGGEKALTAISLLFAIQNLKPSPFCLLDEIEAALDDSNVKRFAKYLHKLTKHTQFIVITHRQGTMVAADVLYGITMQEKGISTLVSVNLIEQQLKEQELVTGNA